jgi:hypothetical protein
VLGRLVRAAGAIPIHRPSDPGSDLRDNLRAFDAAAARLAAGGLVAVFPEGTTHDDPRLRALRTGAARIALLAAPRAPGLALVPATLAFTDKGTFRSDAVLQIGPPIPVPPTPGEPTAAEARALTDELAAAMGELTLQADRAELLGLAAFVAEVLEPPNDTSPVTGRVALSRALLAGAVRLRAIAPARVTTLEERAAGHERALRRHGLSPRLLEVAAGGRRAALGTALRALAVGLLAPIALPAAALHLPAYRAVDRLARRLARRDASMLATLKLIAGAVFFPLTWVALAAAVGLALGPVAAAGALAASPALAVAALTLSEGGPAVLARARAVRLGWREPQVIAALRSERDALRAEILALDDTPRVAR